MILYLPSSIRADQTQLTCPLLYYLSKVMTKPNSRHNTGPLIVLQDKNAQEEAIIRSCLFLLDSLDPIDLEPL